MTDATQEGGQQTLAGSCWVRPYSVDNCLECGQHFVKPFKDPVSGFIHALQDERANCRRCGQVFCGKCLQQEIKIPDAEVAWPPNWAFVSFNPEEPMMACNACVLEMLHDLQPKITGGGAWVEDEDVSSCGHCGSEFSVTKWKYHCMRCGYIFCDDCSTQRILLPESDAVKVPDAYMFGLAKVFSDPKHPLRVCERCVGDMRNFDPNNLSAIAAVLDQGGDGPAVTRSPQAPPAPTVPTSPSMFPLALEDNRAQPPRQAHNGTGHSKAASDPFDFGDSDTEIADPPARRPKSLGPSAVSRGGNGGPAARGTPQSPSKPGKWIADEDVSDCTECHSRFGGFNRKHHCRKCGRVFCQSCTPHKLLVPPHLVLDPPNVLKKDRADPKKQQRCCQQCADLLGPLQADLQSMARYRPSEAS